MITIRTVIMIMTIASSLMYNNAQAMEQAFPLPSIEQVSIKFFFVNNEKDFLERIKFGKGASEDICLYWYRIPTYPVMTPEAMQRNFDATKKINSTILQELGYSAEDLEKYALRAKKGFHERLQSALHIKNT